MSQIPLTQSAALHVEKGEYFHLFHRYNGVEGHGEE